jgi:manganese/zinc/iron transport system ATP- binding protein
MESNKSTPAVVIKQLMVNYEKTPVLWDVSLEAPQGVILGIVGPNGAGKSTLMKTMLGLMKPLSGTVEFFGKPLEAVRQKIAYVPQKEMVDWDFPITVLDLVLMGRYRQKGLFRWMGKADREAAYNALETVGMLPYKDRQISQLSGGQQQRAFIARALLQEADLYLLDEPFTGVDIATEKLLVNLLKDMRSQGKTIWMVHHDLKSAEEYFDWAVVLNMSLIACGPQKQVLTKDILKRAYGQDHILLSEANKLSRQKAQGSP